MGAILIDNLKIIDENSPLELKMEAALKEASINYKSQFSIHEQDKWNAKYIIDFLVFGEHCKIAIECDGVTYHSTREAKERDLKRDLWVKRHGIDDTLRFNTEQIKYDISGVIRQIQAAIESYDQLKYEKQKKRVFDIQQIPSIVPKKDVEFLITSIAPNVEQICKQVIDKIKIKERIRTHIVNEIKSFIKSERFAELYNLLGSFELQNLATSPKSYDLLFGAFNIPCVVCVQRSVTDVKISQSIANDPRILKVIVIYGISKASKFKGKSFVVINGLSGKKNKVISSDILLAAPKIDDQYEYEKKRKKASKLEKELHNIYRSIYKLESYKRSLKVQPFNQAGDVEREKLNLSISRFVLSNKSICLIETKESFDLAIDWCMKEGIYFKSIPFTLHDVAIVIQYYRNRLAELESN